MLCSLLGAGFRLLLCHVQALLWQHDGAGSLLQQLVLNTSWWIPSGGQEPVAVVRLVCPHGKLSWQ